MRQGVPSGSVLNVPTLPRWNVLFTPIRELSKFSLYERTKLSGYLQYSTPPHDAPTTATYCTHLVPCPSLPMQNGRLRSASPHAGLVVELVVRRDLPHGLEREETLPPSFYLWYEMGKRRVAGGGRRGGMVATCTTTASTDNCATALKANSTPHLRPLEYMHLRPTLQRGMGITRANIKLINFPNYFLIHADHCSWSCWFVGCPLWSVGCAKLAF